MTGGKKTRVSITLWALAGGIIAVIVMAFYQFVMLKQAGVVDQFTIRELALEKMQLPLFGVLGAVMGAAIGLLEKIVLALRDWFRNRKETTEYDSSEPSPDEIIQRMRRTKADQYLTDKQSDELTQPHIENTITARNGTLTYKVLAYRVLSEQEIMEIVTARLNIGALREPAPGGVAVVATDIGKPQSRNT